MKILITGCASENNLGSMIAMAFKKENPLHEIIAINHPKNQCCHYMKNSVIKKEYLCDLSGLNGTLNICTEISAIENDIDIFIHAAGVSGLGWFKEINEEDFINTMNINAISPIFILKSLLQLFTLKSSASLFISSNASHVPMRCSLAYNMSKAALTMGMKQIARELTIPNSMTIFSISPNKLKGTRMSMDVDMKVPGLRGWTREQADEIQNSAMVNGKQTDPVELANFIVYLLSRKERHIMLSGCDIPYGA